MLNGRERNLPTLQVPGAVLGPRQGLPQGRERVVAPVRGSQAGREVDIHLCHTYLYTVCQGVRDWAVSKTDANLGLVELSLHPGSPRIPEIQYIMEPR